MSHAKAPKVKRGRGRPRKPRENDEPPPPRARQVANVYDKKFRLVEALCTDCRILLSRFELHNTLRFAKFCEVWEESNFALIYYAKPDDKGRTQLVEYLMRIFCGYLGPSGPPQYRVGAVYALYSVYKTQIHTPRSKIRVTMTVWKEIQELHQEIIEQQHHDVDYIIRALKDECAFHFVAMPIQLACGSKEAIPENERELGSAKGNLTGILQDLEPFHDMVTSLQNVDEEYKKMKESLLNSCDFSKLSDPRSLQIISSDFIPGLESEIQEYEEWKSNFQAESSHKSTQAAPPVDMTALGLLRPELTATKAAFLTYEEGRSSEESAVPESRARRIASIKKNAFAAVGKGSKRGNQLVSDESDEASASQPSSEQTAPTYKRGKRKRCFEPSRQLFIRKKITNLRQQLKESDNEPKEETPTTTS